jgi:hypothetical protein
MTPCLVSWRPVSMLALTLFASAFAAEPARARGGFT